MWMSNVLIVIDRNNADKNSIADIVAALGEIDGQLIGIDEQNHVIEAAVPAHELATVKAIDGVCYVRSVFSYFSAGPAPTRAA
jgi:hypothetical protein